MTSNNSGWKRYSDEFKQEAVRRIREGTSQVELAKELGLTKATLSHWNTNWKRKKKEENTAPESFAQKKKDYSEMDLSELLEVLPSEGNKDFAIHLTRQYKTGKEIAVRYCLVILDPPKDSRGGHHVKH